MYQSENIHKYPRLLTNVIVWICTLCVLINSTWIGVIALRLLWSNYGYHDTFIKPIPLLPTLVGWLQSSTKTYATTDLITPLAWSALTFLITLLLRNAFPVVRTNAQGMLVEFAGVWLPVPWENTLALKVTQDQAAERFVLIAQTNKDSLTGWHRLYSFFYSLSWEPGFYITSQISDFDQLVQTMLSESERTARASETARPLQLDEQAQSLFFRLLLSPRHLFSPSPSNREETGGAPALNRSDGSISADYPSHITQLISGGLILLTGGMLLRYLASWSNFLALEVPALREIPPFNWNQNDPRYAEIFATYPNDAIPFMGFAEHPHMPDPWWILVSAHLGLLLSIIAILWISNLLPAIESRNEGIAIRDRLRKRWRLVPWKKIYALKLTELSEQSQILLLQGRSLPLVQRLTSLFYDGSAKPGVLITSTINSFQPMLEHALGQITAIETNDGSPILQQEARSPILWMAFGGPSARQTFVQEARADAKTRTITPRDILPVARTMAIITLPPALLFALGGLLSEQSPSFGLIIGTLVFWIMGMLEWPLISLISVLLDERTGGGEEGYRVFYLYPSSQLPRYIPLIAAVILQIIGIPLLPILAWLAAVVWSFWLSRGFWEDFYEWRDSLAILGGLLPIIWQLLLLISYLLVTR